MLGLGEADRLPHKTTTGKIRSNFAIVRSYRLLLMQRRVRPALLMPGQRLCSRFLPCRRKNFYRLSVQRRMPGIEPGISTITTYRSCSCVSSRRFIFRASSSLRSRRLGRSMASASTHRPCGAGMTAHGHRRGPRGLHRHLVPIAALRLSSAVIWRSIRSISARLLPLVVLCSLTSPWCAAATLKPPNTSAPDRIAVTKSLFKFHSHISLHWSVSCGRSRPSPTETVERAVLCPPKTKIFSGT